MILHSFTQKHVLPLHDTSHSEVPVLFQQKIRSTLNTLIRWSVAIFLGLSVGNAPFVLGSRNYRQWWDNFRGVTTAK